jgi:hypothetical protein
MEIVECRIALFFYLNGQAVDFRGQDKVIFRQAADGMGPDFDPSVTVLFHMQIGMAAFFFRKSSDRIEKIHACQKILSDQYR